MAVKSILAINNLASILKQRLSALAQAISFDTDNNPVILVGSGVATQETFVVKFKPIPALWSTNPILGTAQPVYSPYVAQLCIEACSGAGAQPLTWTDKLTIIGLLTAGGWRTELHETATGTAPSVAAIDAGTVLKATFELEQKYFGMPGMGQ